MQPTSDYKRRAFQLWEYTVSHGSLLIRSPKCEEYKTNLDIIFIDVVFVQLPRFFNGIEIVPPESEEIQHLSKLLAENLSADAVYVISSAGQRHCIVASFIKFDENQNDIFDSPFKF